MNLQTIANNNKQSQANAESIKRYFFSNQKAFKRYFFTDSIRTKYQSFSILTTQSSISDQLNELTTKHNESWSSVDSFLSKQVLFYLSKGGCLKHFLSERYGERVEFLAHDRPTEYDDDQFKSSKPGAEYEQA